jgi:SMP-30/gluconolaconase/LRE-like protein
MKKPFHERRISRRVLIQRLGTAAGLAAVAPRLLAAQAPAAVKREPLSTVTMPPRDFGPDAPPVTYPDPDVLAIDPMFNRYRVGNTAIHRLWTGGMWCEGPAWCAQGRYLVWSDIPNNRQLRWLEDDGRVTVFRFPSNNSNGNAYDFQGLQRCHGVDARGQTDRPHSSAGGVRQPHVRRSEAEPPVHGSQPVALCVVRQHAGRGPRLNESPSLGPDRQGGAVSLRPHRFEALPGARV